MNTTSIPTRLTVAVFAATLAVTFAGCATAGAASEADTIRLSNEGAQAAIRFVPSDDDPRGHHVVRESSTTVPAHESTVDDDLSPLTGR